MNVNHQNGVSPPPSGIDYYLTGLEAKREEKDRLVILLEQRLVDAKSQRDSFLTAISVLKSTFGSQASEKTPPLPDSNNENGEVATRPQSDLGKKSLWVKPEASWFDLIRETIRKEDNLVSNQEVANYLGMDELARATHYQSLSGSMSAYRGTGHLAGFAMYKRTANGKAIKQFFTGTLDFFEDVQARKLKPEYEAKFREKMRAQGFYPSVTEAESLFS